MPANRPEFRSPNQKAQSAIEYMMTYAWAIIIIVIAIIVLFQLGLFNTNSAKVQPSACSVYRPDGAGTTAGINTEGLCTGGFPEYVAAFNSGSSANVPVGSSLISNTESQFTISLWLYASSANQVAELVSESGSSNCASASTSIFCLEYSNANIIFGSDGNTIQTTNSFVSQGSWYNVAAVHGTSGNYIYVDGVGMALTGNFMIGKANNIQLSIGSDGNGDFFNGQLSNIQIYNASLSSNIIQVLYSRGIGGVPINLDNLVAWLPLNGNGNDYSGNNHNGKPSGVTFSTTWPSTFSSPTATTSVTTSVTSTTSSTSTSTSTSTIHYVVITLDNAQSSSTGTNFQEMLNIDSANYGGANEIASNWDNVEFTSGAPANAPNNGNTPLYAWCESGCTNSASNTIVWVNLSATSIYSDSNAVIYMTFLPNAIMTGPNSYMGEAPEIPGTYGEYDNGVHIFSEYQNFAGSSTPTGWSSGGDAVFDNGFSMAGSSSHNYVVSDTSHSIGIVADWYANVPNVCSCSSSAVGIGSSNGYVNGNPSQGSNMGLEVQANDLFDTGNGVSSISNAGSTTISGLHVWSVDYISGGTMYAQIDYGNQISSTTDLPSGSLYLGAMENSPSGYTLTATWARTRAYPPSGVMPSASFSLN